MPYGVQALTEKTKTPPFHCENGGVLVYYCTSFIVCMKNSFLNYCSWIAQTKKLNSIFIFWHVRKIAPKQALKNIEKKY